MCPLTSLRGIALPYSHRPALSRQDPVTVQMVTVLLGGPQLWFCPVLYVLAHRLVHGRTDRNWFKQP